MKTIIFSLYIGLLITFINHQSYAFYTEVGTSYSYKKTSISNDSYLESELKTASVSFYIWERVALEFSYSEGVTQRREKDSTGQINTGQYHNTIYGSDVIVGFADRKAIFQPFVKAGLSHIQKTQTIQYGTGNPSTTNVPLSSAPSWGGGFKIKLTDSFNLTATADYWQSPLDDGNKTNDMATRIGASWIF